MDMMGGTYMSLRGFAWSVDFSDPGEKEIIKLSQRTLHPRSIGEKTMISILTIEVA